MKKIKFIVLFLLLFFTLTTIVKAEDYSKYFEQFKDDKIYLDVVLKEKEDFYGTLEFVLYGEYGYYGDDNSWLGFSISEDYRKVDVTLHSEGIVPETRTYDIVYKEAETKVAKKLDNYTEKMQKKIDKARETGAYGYDYNLEDLNIINYYSNYDKNSRSKDNNAVNYSIDLKREFENSNITYKLDTRAGYGCEDSVISYIAGYFNLLYKGVIYDAVYGIGVIKKNIIYIPTDTPKTSEAYIEAANLRIKDYIGKEVKITNAGTLEDLDNLLVSNYDNPMNWEEYDFKDATGGYYYKFEFENVTKNFLIVADSNKMTKKKDIIFETKDLSSDIAVSTSSPIPLDTIIDTNEIEDENELNNYREKLKSENIYAVDISLFSNSLNDYISKLDNDYFSVRIPIPKYLEGKELIVSYITDNGNIEKYEVIIEDTNLLFLTNHFSTYVVSEVIEEEIDDGTDNNEDNKDINDGTDNNEDNEEIDDGTDNNEDNEDINDKTDNNEDNKDINNEIDNNEDNNDINDEINNKEDINNKYDNNEVVINNPKTGENIILYILLNIISFISLVCVNTKLKHVK